jgi:phosphate transport system substrate-binding protein
MKMPRRPSGAAGAAIAALAVLAVVMLAAAGCGSSSAVGNGSSGGSPAPAGSSAPQSSSQTILGAGSTFVFPLVSKWASEYQGVAGVQLNYQSIGSGGGISAIEARTVDFGASDAPLQEADLTANHLVQFPDIVGGVLPVVNLKDVPRGALKLSADVLARIYMGQITTWNDPAITALNPTLTLPKTAITVVHRADASGTTWIFTHYLTAAAGSIWTAGADKQINWPVGIGGKGSEGVGAVVKQINGAIGYIEYAYAQQNNMNWTQLQNKDGKFVSPSVPAFEAAAASADWAAMPGFYVLLVNQPGATTWPITGASFVLMQASQASAARAQTTLKFFDWCYKNGVAAAQSLDYVPLPAKVVNLIEASWQNITAAGAPVWPAG